jgi:actin-like ATPase involved in cell morphogenesis
MVKGRRSLEALPKWLSLTASRFMRRSSARHEDCAIDSGSLEALPPEASGDLYDRGLVLAGGAALLAGFDERISRRRSSLFSWRRAGRAVIRGLGTLFENPLTLRKAIIRSC